MTVLRPGRLTRDKDRDTEHCWDYGAAGSWHAGTASLSESVGRPWDVMCSHKTAELSLPNKDPWFSKPRFVSKIKTLKRRSLTTAPRTRKVWNLSVVQSHLPQGNQHADFLPACQRSAVEREGRAFVTVFHAGPLTACPESLPTTSTWVNQRPPHAAAL